MSLAWYSAWTSLCGAIRSNARKRFNSPDTFEASEMVVALVPLLEPDISDATVPPSPKDFFAVLRKPTVALTYVKNGT